MDQKLEDKIISVLKTIHDPEIPVNIYDLGLIYNIKEIDGLLQVDMTLTAPGCPLADEIMAEVNEKLTAIDGIKKVAVSLVFDPPWSMAMLSEEAKLELGFL